MRIKLNAIKYFDHYEKNKHSNNDQEITFHPVDIQKLDIDSFNYEDSVNISKLD